MMPRRPRVVSQDLPGLFRLQCEMHATRHPAWLRRHQPMQALYGVLTECYLRWNISATL
jgi:hypothetical protein